MSLNASTLTFFLRASNGSQPGTDEGTRQRIAAERRQSWQSALEQAALASWFSRTPESQVAVSNSPKIGHNLIENAHVNLLERNHNATNQYDVTADEGGLGTYPATACVNGATFSDDRSTQIGAQVAATVGPNANVPDALASQGIAAAPSVSAQPETLAFVTRAQHEPSLSASAAYNRQTILTPPDLFQAKSIGSSASMPPTETPSRLAEQPFSPTGPAAELNTWLSAQVIPSLGIEVAPVVTSYLSFSVEGVGAAPDNGWVGTSTDHPETLTGEDVVEAQRVVVGKNSNGPNDLAPRTSVRIHSEWSDVGVHIWLGLDTLAAPLMDRLVAQIQSWLEAHGTRLVALVCNGRVVERDSSQVFLAQNASSSDDDSFQILSGKLERAALRQASGSAQSTDFHYFHLSPQETA